MITYSQEIIEKLLVAGSLPHEESRLRAPLVVDAFDWINFKTLEFHARASPASDPFCIPEYFFGDTGFCVHNAEHAGEIKSTWIGGTGLDRGHLQFFSMVAKSACDLIPQYWRKSKNMKDELRNPHQHLNCLEEIFWLSRWIRPQNIIASKRLLADSECDVDWQLHFGSSANDSIVINLEVKRIVGDVLRHIKGRTFKLNWFDDFCREKVLPKFRQSQPHEINVLAMTMIGAIDRDIQRLIAEWLTDHQVLIDAVLVTARESHSTRPFDWHFRNTKSGLLKCLLIEPSLEEQSLIYDLIHPIEVAGIPNNFNP